MPDRSGRPDSRRTLIGIQVETLAALVAKNMKAGEDRRLTVFKSVGLALEDVAVAAFVFEQATPARSSAGPRPATR